jgi:hypothetical protein
MVEQASAPHLPLCDMLKDTQAHRLCTQGPAHPQVVLLVKLVGLGTRVGDEALLVQLLGVAHDALTRDA